MLEFPPESGQLPVRGDTGRQRTARAGDEPAQCAGGGDARPRPPATPPACRTFIMLDRAGSRVDRRQVRDRGIHVECEWLTFGGEFRCRTGEWPVKQRTDHDNLDGVCGGSGGPGVSSVEHPNVVASGSIAAHCDACSGARSNTSRSVLRRCAWVRPAPRHRLGIDPGQRAPGDGRNLTRRNMPARVERHRDRRQHRCDAEMIRRERNDPLRRVRPIPGARIPTRSLPTSEPMIRFAGPCVPPTDVLLS